MSEQLKVKDNPSEAETPSTPTTITNPTTSTPQSISIVSLEYAASYHGVSRQAIHKQIKKGTFQHINGIPAHQLDNYKPDRKAQEYGRQKASKVVKAKED